MPTIFDYIASMDAAAVDNPTGNGFCALPQPMASGTATSGVVAAMDLPAPIVEASANWAPTGVVTLPALTGDGTTDGYRPAWGDVTLPALAAEGQAHVVIDSMAILPPLFALGYAGATGEMELPAMDALGIDAALHRHGNGVAAIPVTALGLSCGLDKPLDAGAPSAAVVNLLQQGNMTLADAAASICAYDDTDDDRAMSVTYFVSNLMAYVQDSASGIGDRWTCALATWLRKYGDCEDGAILIHALLLAAGVDPGRVRTAFGMALTTDLVASGHAWVMYRRLTDEEWIPLEWTFQPSPYDHEIEEITRQVDMAATYTKISYILTDQTFSAVTDADYIAHLAPNRTAGAVTLPLPAVAATTGNGASAALTFWAGTLATTLAVSGQAGARADMAISAPAVAGTATQAATARGLCAVPALAALGTTGAVGVCDLPRATVAGLCGGSAWADLALPVPALSATATTAALVTAALLFPHPDVAATAGVGAVSAGEAVFPAPRATGRAGQGPVGRADLTLPRATVAGLALPVSTGAGDCTLPLPAVRGRGGRAASWTGTLSYNPERWT
uniref:Transglutaminase-like superfamily protein n=1 Tax=Desulfovibrio sp. U5L TaxID=596152 RepID=I2Q1D3_9BACT